MAKELTERTSKNKAPVSALTTFKPAPQTDDEPDYKTFFLDEEKEMLHKVKKLDGTYHKPEAEFAAFIKTVLSNGQTVEDLFYQEFPNGHLISMEAIHEAAQFVACDDKLETLKLFIEADADLSFVNCNDVSTLDSIAREGQNKVIEYMIDELGINFNCIGHYTPEPTADNPKPVARGGHLPIVSAGYGRQENTIKLLVSRGVCFTGIDQNGSTVLHALLLRNANRSLAIDEMLQEQKLNAQVALRLVKLYIANGQLSSQQKQFISSKNIKKATPLRACMFSLCFLHQQFGVHKQKQRDASTAELNLLTGLLQPHIELGLLIRSLSNHSFADKPQEHPDAILPIEIYLTSPDMKSYLRDLFYIDRDFTRAIYSDCLSSQCQSSKNGNDIHTFTRIIAEVERENKFISR